MFNLLLFETLLLKNDKPINVDLMYPKWWEKDSKTILAIALFSYAVKSFIKFKSFIQVLAAIGDVNRFLIYILIMKTLNIFNPSRTSHFNYNCDRNK